MTNSSSEIEQLKALAKKAKKLKGSDTDYGALAVEGLNKTVASE